MRAVGGVGQAAGAEAVADAEGDVILAHDVADVFPMGIHRVLLVVMEHPFREEGAAPADDADQTVFHEGEMLLEDAGVDCEVIDTLSGLMTKGIEDDFAVELFDPTADDHAVNGDGPDGDGAIADDRVAALVEVSASGEIPDGVRAPAVGPFEFFHFLIGTGGNRARAHIRVDFSLAGAANGHRVELIAEVDFVGGDDHPTGGDFIADLGGGQVKFPFGDTGHFGSDGAETGVFQLGDGLERRGEAHLAVGAIGLFEDDFTGGGLRGGFAVFWAGEFGGVPAFREEVPGGFFAGGGHAGGVGAGKSPFSGGTGGDWGFLAKLPGVVPV